MNEKTLIQVPRYLIVGSIVAAVVCTFLFGISDNLGDWFIQLFATIIAAILAGAVALWLYLKQRDDKRNHVRDLLIFYMDHLISTLAFWNRQKPPVFVHLRRFLFYCVSSLRADMQ